ncbi:formate dehydrogenase accessory protein FdhE [compost metagenome]
MTGAQAGLRYLQCSLCECRWHMVRVKCSNCEATGALDYWSLERQDAAVKAESCNDCHSYLKVFYPEKDRDQELLADDLASLALDAEVEREGFGRSGVSPFLFPG